MENVYLLDLIGTFAFSVYGSHIAVKKKFDLFGIFVCGALPGVGGGTIRELILGNIPFYFYDGMYFVMIGLGILFSIVTFQFFHKVDRYILLFDAVGLSTFAYIGAAKAAEAGLGVTGMILLAVVTAVGGGVLKDIAINDIPDIFHRELYATPAALLGLIYFIFEPFRSHLIFVYGLIFGVIFLRMLAIHFEWILYKPNK